MKRRYAVYVVGVVALGSCYYRSLQTEKKPGILEQKVETTNPQDTPCKETFLQRLQKLDEKIGYWLRKF